VVNPIVYDVGRSWKSAVVFISTVAATTQNTIEPVVIYIAPIPSITVLVNPVVRYFRRSRPGVFVFIVTVPSPTFAGFPTISIHITKVCTIAVLVDAVVWNVCDTWGKSWVCVIAVFVIVGVASGDSAGHDVIVDGPVSVTIPISVPGAGVYRRIIVSQAITVVVQAIAPFIRTRVDCGLGVITVI
jgi:hypothetical protein